MRIYAPSFSTAPVFRNIRDGAAAQVSQEILKDVPLVDVRKVLVVGSGGLSIGQAGEFDYSGKLYDCCTFFFLRITVLIY